MASGRGPAFGPGLRFGASGTRDFASRPVTNARETPQIANGPGGVVQRLRARRDEIEAAIAASVRDVVPDQPGGRDADYLVGVRVTVAAAVDYGLSGLEQGSERASVPAQIVSQAHLAARKGVGLDAVLRRYIVGNALLLDFIMEEAHRGGEDGAVRTILRSQASLLDQVATAVSVEYRAEAERVSRSREHRLAEQVKALLDGEPRSGERFSRTLDPTISGYELHAKHLGMIVRGAGARSSVERLASSLDRRLLCVAPSEQTVWAWLGGQRVLEMSAVRGAITELRRVGFHESTTDTPVRSAAPRAQTSQACPEQGGLPSELSFAIGEHAGGLEGWRTTHRQAEAALTVALRMPRQGLTRYADVALLASALKDDMLASSLVTAYLTPLDQSRFGGHVLRRTLRAYLSAGRNISAAASALGVARNTIEGRLRAVEERLDRSLHGCSAELDVALRLDELRDHAET